MDSSLGFPKATMAINLPTTKSKRRNPKNKRPRKSRVLDFAHPHSFVGGLARWPAVVELTLSIDSTVPRLVVHEASGATMNFFIIQLHTVQSYRDYLRVLAYSNTFEKSRLLFCAKNLTLRSGHQQGQTVIAIGLFSVLLHFGMTGLRRCQDRRRGVILALRLYWRTAHFHPKKHQRYLSDHVASSTSSCSLLPPARAPVHYVPRSARGSTFNSMIPLDPFYDNRIQRISRISPTRDLNYTEDAWENHRSPWRHLRHISQVLDSSPFQRLLYPHLSLVFGIGCGVWWINAVLPPGLHPIAISAPQTFGAVTTAITLLTGFRTNASYGRMAEARAMWGEVTNCCRDLARETYLYIKCPGLRERMIRLVKAYPIALNFFLTNQRGGHHMVDKNATSEDLLAEFEAELVDVCYRGSNPTNSRNDKDLIRILTTFYKGGHTPLMVLSCMTEVLSDVAREHENHHQQVHPIYIRQMEDQLNRLTIANGERILRTPLPTGFTRHTSRLLGMWSYVLPLVVYPQVVPWMTPIVSVVISYSVVAVEDVGVSIEEPFHVLPLRQYSEGIADQIDQIVDTYNDSHRQREQIIVE